MFSLCLFWTSASSHFSYLQHHHTILEVKCLILSFSIIVQHLIQSLSTGFRPPSATVVSAEPFSHGTRTLRCLQKEMATYRHWSVSLWRDPDNVPHCRILSRQNWMAAYLGYTLQMKTLFRGWPVMVHDTHTRRRRLSSLLSSSSSHLNLPFLITKLTGSNLNNSPSFTLHLLSFKVKQHIQLTTLISVLSNFFISCSTFIGQVLTATYQTSHTWCTYFAFQFYENNFSINIGPMHAHHIHKL